MAKVLVLFSGGLDSTAALCCAINVWQKENVTAMFLDYGQKHIVEKQAAELICKELGVPLVSFKTDILTQIGGSSLTDHKMEMVQTDGKKTTNTFVPGRNVLFLTIAASYCFVNDFSVIYTGIRNAPAFLDCTERGLASLQKTLQRTVCPGIILYHPIFNLNRGETVELLVDMGGTNVMKYTTSCYNGYPPCGECKPCKDRAAGFAEYGIKDPLIENGTFNV